MKIAKCIPWIFTFLNSSVICWGQDTIRIEPGIYYTSDIEPNRGKDFASRARFAREDIVFSNTRKEIDYCYYYDNKRYCIGQDFELINDSTLSIDGVRWTYKLQGKQFLVYRYEDNFFESGYTKSLIPFEPTGPFTTTTADKIDTLWTTDYSTDKPSKPYDHPTYNFYKAKIKGKVYKPGEVDQPCTFLNGDTLARIYLQRKDGCYGEPLYVVRTMKFIVTQEGHILNIEQDKGNMDLNFCPYYAMELMKYIKRWGLLKPAKRKGQNVNSICTVAIDMGEGY
jgi:Fe-S-cluster containining protein